MSRQALADQHLATRTYLALSASRLLTRHWRQVDHNDILRSWRAQVSGAANEITQLQVQSARSAEQYMTAALTDVGRTRQGPQINPAGFAGFTYPLGGQHHPMQLATALQSPAYKTLGYIQHGIPLERALAGGLDNLIMHGSTAVADAGRQADGVAGVTEPQVTGYIRQTEPGACSRCLILSGRIYRTNDGFQRHPNCLCEHVPWLSGESAPAVADPYEAFEAMSREEQDRRFGAGSAQAIRDGADIFQVVNAERGMSTTAHGSRITTEGMARGHARRTLGTGELRMMPEEIYRRLSHIPAGEHYDRLVTEFLTKHGYLVGPQVASGAVRGGGMYASTDGPL